MRHEITEQEFRSLAEREEGGFISYGLQEDTDCPEEAMEFDYNELPPECRGPVDDDGACSCYRVQLEDLHRPYPWENVLHPRNHRP